MKTIRARVLAIPMAVAIMLMLGLSAPAAATVDDDAAAGVEVTVQDVMAGVNSGDIAVHASENTLNASEATVDEIDSDEGIFTAVTVPIEDSYNMLSNLTVVFDEAGDISNYSETLYSENDAGNFQLTQYTDGELVKDEDMGIAYMADAELMEDINNSVPTEGNCSHAEDPGMGTQSVGAVATCISGALGIGGVAAYLMAGACGGSCVGGVVPVCAACISVYGAIATGGMGAVVGCFQLL